MTGLQQSVSRARQLVQVIVLVLAGLLLIAAKDVPSARDGIKTGYLDVAGRNMPAKLVGVASKWDKKCREGDTQQCLRLARAFETGIGDLRASPLAATGYHTLACRRGVGPSCAEASDNLREGWVGFADAAAALELARRGCETLADGESCAALGSSYHAGAGIAQSSERALDLWSRACAAGADTGCRLKAGYLFTESDTAADHAAARALFAGACDANRAWGCAGLAEAHFFGKGAAKSPDDAFVFAKKGCLETQGDRRSVCGRYGEMLVDRGDIVLAGKLMHRACLAGRSSSCNDLAFVGLSDIPGRTTTRKEAVFYARQGCDLGNASACVRLSNIYDGKTVSGFEGDSYRRFALAKRACELGHAGACGSVRGVALPGDYAAATRIDPAWPTSRQLAAAKKEVEGGDKAYGFATVARLMEEGDEVANWWVGNWLLHGLPGVTEARPADGMILIENAARVGHVEALEHMGMAYWYGDIVKQDRPKAELYMRSASARGSEMAGAIFRSMQGEKIREANARLAAEAAARRKRDSWLNWGQALAQWRPSTSISSGPADTGSWARYQARTDAQNFDRALNYTMGRSTVCLSNNPYC